MEIKKIPLNTVKPLIKGKTNNFYAIPEFLLTFPGKLNYYLINWNGRTVLFPYVLTQINKFIKLRKIICPTMPIILDGTLNQSDKYDMINKLEIYLSARYRQSIITIYQLPSLTPFLISSIYRNRWQIAPLFSSILNLNDTKQKIFDGFEKRTRYTLRKFAESSNQELISGEWSNKIRNEIKISTDYQDLRYFYKNWEEIKKNLTIQGINPSEFLEKPVLDKNFRRFSKANLIKLFLIFDKDEEIAASALIFTVKDKLKNSISYYSAGASSSIGRKAGLPTILQWFIITWLKENNYEYYDLGGLDLDIKHGPTFFKKGFGGKLIKGWIFTRQSIFYRLINRMKKYISIKKAQLLQK